MEPTNPDGKWGKGKERRGDTGEKRNSLSPTKGVLASTLLKRWLSCKERKSPFVPPCQSLSEAGNIFFFANQPLTYFIFKHHSIVS